jgi:hypothetical protein
VHVLDCNGYSALHNAADNGAFGVEILKYLIEEHKLDPATLVANSGRDVLSCALSRNLELAKCLLPHLPPNVVPTNVLVSQGDPIGSMSMHVQLGM